MVTKKIFLPVSLDISEKRLLIIGGGRVALHKASLLLRFTANITVVAPSFLSGFEDLPCQRVERAYRPADLEGMFLIYICTDDAALQAEIRAECKRRGLLACVCDCPALCDFISPAIYKAGDLTVSVSSNGTDVKRAIAVRDRIAATLLPTKRVILRKDEVRSTNDFLRQYAADMLPEGSVVWAEQQTAGRGQAGTVWFSEPDKNLTFSIVVYPNVPSGDAQFLLSQIASLSVKEALEHYVEGITLKWPNDIYHRDKKMAGILIEHDLSGATMERSIIGIGINIRQETFPEHIANPVSLLQATGKAVPREEVLERFLLSFERYYQAFREGRLHDLRTAYTAALYRRDGVHPFRDAQGEFEAAIDGVEPSGHLRLRLHNGTVKQYGFKELVFL